jgi:hypothetical protein
LIRMENSVTKKTPKSIRKLESKLIGILKQSIYRRMQNRESAVRSRLRKKYHQDELEVKIMEMEQIQK